MKGVARRVIVSAVAVCCLASSAFAQTEANCSDILRFGVYDEHTYKSNTALRTRFESALCDTDFGTYQEARNFGIGIGVPVYDIPIEASGSFDEAKKNDWFKKRCENKQKSEDFEQFIFDNSKTVNPAIVEAWTKCMTAEIDRRQTGLKCGVVKPTGKDMVFSASWIKGNKNDLGPQIDIAETFGGQCEKPSAAMKLVDGLSVKCSRKSEKEAIAFLLRAEASQCLLVVPGFDVSCGERRFRAADNDKPGNTILADTRISCARIIFEAGAVVRVLKGARVEFAATDSIAVVGDGGATVDGTGEPGAAGANGTNRGDWWQSRGDGDYSQARHDVEGNPNHPDRGYPGQKGGKGGKGATIIFTKLPTGQLSCSAKGGAGGPGGHGGRGKLLKNGRNNYCDGCMYDRPGVDGPQGDIGDDGSCTFLEREQKDPTATAE